VLSPSGIYYGQLDLDPGLGDETDHLVKHHLLPAAVMQPQAGQQGAVPGSEPPLSLVRAAVWLLVHPPSLALAQSFVALR
jgi:hypothetical protein